MIFHTKCGILLVLCTIKFTMKQCVAEDTLLTSQNEDTDEEDAIKEALLLVELLKNAQDKTILRTIDTTVEDSTCAATTLEGLRTPVYNETTSSINPETTTEASILTTPAEQFPQHRRAFMPNWPRMPSPQAYQDHHHRRDEPQLDLYGPRDFFRRRFPDYFYFQNYFDFSRVNKEKPIPGFRRFQNDENQTSSASPVPDKTTTTITTTVSPLISTTKSMIKSTRRLEKKSNSQAKRIISKKNNPKLKKAISHKDPKTKRPLSASTKKTLGTNKTLEEQKMTTEGKVAIANKDPVKDEIASELLKELNGSKIRDKVMNKATKMEKFRTTLRIHLDGSTRYNIPFPENHAFCFTNPESLLCRTP